MEIPEALVIAKNYLAELQIDCPVEIEFNSSITEEYSEGFVFFYNSKEYWRTHDISTSLAGNGPVFVKRDTGEVVVLPSHQSVKRSLSEILGSSC